MVIVYGFWFAFLAGVLLGYLYGHYDSKTKDEKVNIQLSELPKGKTNFYEPITPKERFNKSNDIGDMLDNE